MRRRLIKAICLPLLLLSVTLPAGGQKLQTGWHGKISIGNSHVLLNGDLRLESDGELYTGSGKMEINGTYRGESGSKIYLSSDADTHGFINISGTATGSTEIIPGISDAWDGSRIEWLKASLNGSVTSTFQMNNNAATLQYEKQGNYLIWYVEREESESCLPLIVQLAGHTLLVNNNSETNGGYRFVDYIWYKNGQVLKEGTHADNAGSYYTGGEDLDETAEYTVKVTDSEGKQYLSCPYRFVRFDLPVKVTVYPNPVPRNAKANIRVETEDISLLNSASVEIYDLMGQYVGKTVIDGQRLAPLSLPSKAGVYILKFKSMDYVKDIKVIVE